MAMTVERVDHIVLNVSDPVVSARWYADVLGMRREDDDQGRVVMWFAEQKLHLRPVDADQDDWFTARSPAVGSDDLCFSTPATLAEIEGHLAQRGVGIEVGPVERPGARGTMTSVYCRDPDRSLIEISTYTP